MRAYAAITGLLMLLSSAELALAADWYTGASAPVQKDDWFVAIDTSVSVTSTGSAFGRIAATGSVANPLTFSGPRYRIEGGGGTFTYTSGAGDQVNGTQMYGSFLGGYERVWSRGTVAGFQRDRQLAHLRQQLLGRIGKARNGRAGGWHGAQHEGWRVGRQGPQHQPTRRRRSDRPNDLDRHFGALLAVLSTARFSSCGRHGQSPSRTSPRQVGALWPTGRS